MGELEKIESLDVNKINQLVGLYNGLIDQCRELQQEKNYWKKEYNQASTFNNKWIKKVEELEKELKGLKS